MPFFKPSYPPSSSHRTFARPSKSHLRNSHADAVLAIGDLMQVREVRTRQLHTRSCTRHNGDELTDLLNKKCRTDDEPDLVRKQSTVGGKLGKLAIQRKPERCDTLYGEVEMSKQSRGAAHLLADAFGVGKHVLPPRKANQKSIACPTAGTIAAVIMEDLLTLRDTRCAYSMSRPVIMAQL